MKFQIELCTFSHPLCRGVAYRLGELLFFLPEEAFLCVLIFFTFFSETVMLIFGTAFT